MELELSAQAGTVGGLSRLKALSACRDGRPKVQAIKIVWHDSPDHALLANGLTLAENRGIRRLERLFPGPGAWLPGQPAPVAGDTPDQSELPAPLAPIAAFEGRQTISEHRFADQPVTVTIAKGVLRAVTAEQPAARIWLDGAEQAVRAAALLIAEAEPVSVPLACLAAEGIALATGQTSAPRHQGPPVLPDQSLSVPDALAYILGHLIDVILANAPIAQRPDGAATEAVHQMRVAVRRARSAVSIFRGALEQGALDTVNDSLKQLGSQLGPTRDWDVFAEETLPAICAVLPDDERLDRLAAAVAKRRRECQKALSAYLAGPALRRLGIELAWFAAADVWRAVAVADPAEDPKPPPSLHEFAGPVLQHRWKKLVSLGKRIDELDIPALHGVRLRAKRARYAAEMFASLHHGKATNRFIRHLSIVQQSLGVLNDGAVATQLLAELGGPSGRHAYATGIVTGFLAARAGKIRPRIIKDFEKFRRQQVFWT